MAPQFFQSGMDSTLLLIGGGILLAALVVSRL
jgi:hypothetical protein